MDLAATLDEIKKLPIDDRLRLVDAIWDDIAGEQSEYRISEAHKRELERRLADAEATPDDGLSREEVMDELRSLP